MEKLLKKGHWNIVAQFPAIQVFETPSQPIPSNMLLVLDEHQSIFDTSQGQPPSHESMIILSTHNLCPFRHPFS